MIRRLKEYINQQHLFSPEQQVLLAVSGGRDSVCMARLMHQAGYRFAIAHCNFHLRPGDCDRDQLFVQQLADSLQADFYTVDFDTHTFAEEQGMSIEEAARELRYRWFASLCDEHGFSCVATAHHRDDSVETFFLNLFRGTGIAGLHGIRPISTLRFSEPSSTLTVVHPMLCFSRDEIDRCVVQRHYDYVEDSTNAIPDVRRNQIRMMLMPLLRQLYPSVDTTLLDNMERLHEAGQVYNAHIALLRNHLVRQCPPRVPTTQGTMVTVDLEHLPEPRGTILFELLHPYGFNADNVKRMLRNEVVTGKVFSSPTHDAVIDRGRLVVGERCEAVVPVIDESEERLSGDRVSVYVDADRLERPLRLCLWQGGERFYPFGMSERRKVSDVLKDKKINRLEKRHVWLLVDAADRIVWVVGVCLDNRFRVSNATQRVLHLSLKA